MFVIDEYVIHMTGGICQVKDITPLDIAGADKNKMYYLLMPIRDNGSKVYVPVDNDAAMRKIVTKEQATALIDDIPTIAEMEIENDKMREAKYKEAIKSCDLYALVGVLKNLHARRSERIQAGKKSTATDDKYIKIAEENLNSELAFVLGRDKKEMMDFISERIHEID